MGGVGAYRDVCFFDRRLRDVRVVEHYSVEPLEQVEMQALEAKAVQIAQTYGYQSLSVNVIFGLGGEEPYTRIRAVKADGKEYRRVKDWR